MAGARKLNIGYRDFNVVDRVGDLRVTLGAAQKLSTEALLHCDRR